MLLVTVLTSALISRPTHAESFLTRTTCGVVRLLGVECRSTNPAPPPATPTSPAPSNQAAPAPASASGSQSQAAGQSNPGSTSSQSTAPLAPLSLPDAPLDEVKPLPTGVNTTMSTPSRYTAYTFSGTGYEGGDKSVLGDSTQTPLQSSAEGWKFFGISWYWLFVAATVVYVGWRIVKALLKRAHGKYAPEHS